uniref:Uncharacterized protein n=1 Tax=Micrurus lemniscatus lemniscatus TaxID=129467 RepID=A0A2D4JCP4_MICLE
MGGGEKPDLWGVHGAMCFDLHANLDARSVTNSWAGTSAKLIYCIIIQYAEKTVIQGVTTIKCFAFNSSQQVIKQVNRLRIYQSGKAGLKRVFPEGKKKKPLVP